MKTLLTKKFVNVSVENLGVDNTYALDIIISRLIKRASAVEIGKNYEVMNTCTAEGAPDI